ncbi:hypothetical protein [Nautilia lithotrophica]
MFSESDFEKLKIKALKEAENLANRKINKAKEKLQKQKELFFKSFDMDKEKKLLKLKYEKILKEQELLLQKKYESEFKTIYEKVFEKTKKELLEKIRQNAPILCRCFLNKIDEYEGCLILPKYLKGKCKSRFEITYSDNDCFIFKTENKYIVFDPEESIENVLKGLLCLK